MALSPGARLGNYEILGLLGAGGMGEVYRARDPKLNRDVAIKVLPASLANDADYLARFQREAQVLAALNHPNIAAIYGLEGHAIVMELVEGESPRGPLPVKEALDIARQIAEALEAAHDKGIIHRDLKPGNVKITPGGVVKVLDFGLAKAVERNSTSSADSPTLTMRATEAGLILGTAGYMSPEQAAGKPVDRRADIWSFGVVLYELITGARLFDGETVSHTLADVLRADIDLSKIPEGPVRELIRRCLERNLKNRLSHIGEARYVIDHVGDAVEKPRSERRSKFGWVPWAIAAAAVAVGVIGWMRPRPSSSPVARFEIHPPELSRTRAASEEGGSAISPDGSMIAFAALSSGDVSMLYIRPMDSLTARQIPGTEGAARPFWSPDSKALAFVAGGKLKRLEVSGIGSQTIAEVSRARGGDWRADGEILFSDQTSDIRRISAFGGIAASVTHIDKTTELSHYYPQFLPDGKSFLYLMRTLASMSATPEALQNAGIYVGSLDGKPPVLLVRSAFKAVYDPATQMLLYTRDGPTLLAQRMELSPPRLTGEPVVIAEKVSRSRNNGYLDFSISTSGTLLYSMQRATSRGRFAWRDRSGKVVETAGNEIIQIGNFALSPDGTRVAYSTSATPEASAGTWVTDLSGGTITRIVPQNSFVLRWSPDGKFLYWPGTERIMRKRVDGSGTEEIVFNNTLPLQGFAVSPDGNNMLVVTNEGLRLVSLHGEQKVEMFEASRGGRVAGPRFSPDGRWVAFVDSETGKLEVAVRGFPEKRGKWIVSTNGGHTPAWRSDGKELYWLSGITLMAADIDITGETVRVGKPKPLFQLLLPIYYPSNNGQRFFVFEESSQAEAPMVVVQNWAAGLGK